MLIFPFSQPASTYCVLIAFSIPLIISLKYSFSTSLDIEGIVIYESDRLRYLGIDYGPTTRSTIGLIKDNVSRSLTKCYGKAVSLRNSVNKSTLAKIFNAVVTPSILYISPLWELLKVTQKRQLRTHYYKLAKFLLRLPLWFSNSYISSRYGIIDPVTKIGEIDARACHQSIQFLADSSCTAIVS